MKTDDIQCESSVNGYNSSIILWRKNFATNLYEYMLKYDKWINNQVIRFDHYLEFVIKNSNFIQDLFQGQVLDYNTYCKEKDILPEGSSIIAFPRNPKPHECKEKWINDHWI
jgi:hypothetical protein